MAKALSSLANLIDHSIQVRGVGFSVRDFAASFLGVSSTGVTVSSRDLAGLEFQLVGLALAEDLESHPPETLIGMDADEPPRWQVIDLGELQVEVPHRLAAAFAPGALAPCPLVVWVGEAEPEGVCVSVFARAADAAQAHRYLEGLVERARTRTNPFRGRVVETSCSYPWGLQFRVASLTPATREDLVLPPGVWQELDRNVHGFFKAVPTLSSAGLSRSRGVLLEGPPGTGKTAACRILAQELPGVTAIFCDAATVGRGARDLYRHLNRLAPAVVVMEDIDLIVGHRRHGAGDALNDFLLALDGAMSTHEAVVTIATTNALGDIDPAARRASRFDAVVSLPLPDRRGRAAILRRYLRGVANDVDAEQVAGITSGMTGADLRELISRAVIGRASGRDGLPLQTSALLALAGERRDRGSGGGYL